MMQPHGFLDELARAAEAASAAEGEFRRTISARIAALEQERSFAFRRLNLMRAVTEAVEQADSDASATGACRAMLMGRLGWSGISDAERETLERFAPVAEAARCACRPPAPEAAGDTPPADPAGALGRFEAWYAASRGTPFWLLFDHVMPETPLVDF